MSTRSERSFQNKDKRRRARFPKRYSYMMLLAVVIIVLFFSNNLANLFNHVDEEVVEYLHVDREYTSFNYEEVNPTIENLYDVPAELLLDLQIVHESFQADLMALEPPPYFENYHESLLKSVSHQQAIIDEAISAQGGDVARLNELIEQYNEVNAQLYDGLVEGLEKNKIAFQEKGNGLLEYEVKISNPSKEYKYTKAQEEFFERWDDLLEE